VRVCQITTEQIRSRDDHLGVSEKCLIVCVSDSLDGEGKISNATVQFPNNVECLSSLKLEFRIYLEIEIWILDIKTQKISHIYSAAQRSIVRYLSHHGMKRSEIFFGALRVPVDVSAAFPPSRGA
jgi:hypothetical protein